MLVNQSVNQVANGQALSSINLAGIQANTSVLVDSQSVLNQDDAEQSFTRLFGLENSTKTVQFPAERLTKQEIEVTATMKECDLIAEKCADYEAEFIARGNIALYDLLQRIYVVATQINASEFKTQILLIMRDSLGVKGIKIQANTPELTVLTKYVVGGDRKRASNYSRVLRIALEDQVPTNELASYITRRGGMGKIYNNEQKATAIEEASGTTKERLALMKEYLLLTQYESKTEFKYDEPINLHNSDKQGKAETASFCFFLTSYDRSKDVYRVISGHDFGRSYEDNILRFMIKSATTDIEKIRKGVDSYKQKLKAKVLMPMLDSTSVSKVKSNLL
jgi:hypothetical protein